MGIMEGMGMDARHIRGGSTQTDPQALTHSTMHLHSGDCVLMAARRWQGSDLRRWGDSGATAKARVTHIARQAVAEAASACHTQAGTRLLLPTAHRAASGLESGGGGQTGCDSCAGDASRGYCCSAVVGTVVAAHGCGSVAVPHCCSCCCRYAPAGGCAYSSGSYCDYSCGCHAACPCCDPQSGRGCYPSPSAAPSCRYVPPPVGADAAWAGLGSSCVSCPCNMHRAYACARARGRQFWRVH